MNDFFFGKVSHLVVVVIAGKEVLGGLAAERDEVLLELLVLNVTPLFIDVLLVEVVLLGRDERCLDPLLFEVIPRIVSQPRVILHLFSTV